ncbi:MAG: hypothetical protein ACO3A2_00630 [Bdellovibrionia bacterium]
MVLLAASAAFIGLVHSLAPGHWLPVVLMAKARHWPMRKALFGALLVASGHILLSVVLGVISIYLELHFLEAYEHLIEQFAGLGLIVFGLIYAASSYFRHSSCHGHTHHGPDPKDQNAPYWFLLSLGFTPCVAAIPIFLTAASRGSFSALFSFIAFSCGVLGALISATYFFSKGLLKLDHPIFEHYGDVITGGSVFVMGAILFFF